MSSLVSRLRSFFLLAWLLSFCRSVAPEASPVAYSPPAVARSRRFATPSQENESDEEEDERKRPSSSPPQRLVENEALARLQQQILQQQQELAQHRQQSHNATTLLEQLLQRTAASAANPPPAFLGASAPPPSSRRSIRIKLQPPAKFNGEIGASLEVWKREIESHFDYYAEEIASDTDKIRYATAHLGDAARTWWSSAKQAGDIITYEQFKEALNARYRPVLASDQARTQLLALRSGSKQAPTVSDYINAFQSLLAHINNMGEADQVHQFTRGLPAAVAQRVREQTPSTLAAAISFAVKYEGSLAIGVANSAASATPRATPGAMPSGSAMDLSNVEAEPAAPGGAATSTNPDLSVQIGQLYALLSAPPPRGRGRPRAPRRQPGERENGKEKLDIPGKVIAERITANQCIKCGETGHWKNECKNPSKK